MIDMDKDIKYGITSGGTASPHTINFLQFVPVCQTKRSITNKYVLLGCHDMGHISKISTKLMDKMHHMKLYNLV